MYIIGMHHVVLCLALAAGCVFSISSEKNEDDSMSERNLAESVNSHTLVQSDILRRVIRSGSRSNCNTWSPWVNDNHPSSSNKTDREFVPLKTRASFCHAGVGGNISKFECKDEKGEAFHGNKTLHGLKGQFLVLCYDINVGVECIAPNATKDHCPDMSMRYYCKCPSTAGISVNSTSTPPKGTVNTTITANDQESKDGLPLLWLILVPSLAALLFLLNTCLAVCIYKKIMRTIQEKDRKTAVHPL